MKTSFVVLLALVASFIGSTFSRLTKKKIMKNGKLKSSYWPGVGGCIRRPISDPYDYPSSDY